MTLKQVSISMTLVTVCMLGASLALGATSTTSTKTHTMTMTKTRPESQATLAKEAKISRAAARKTALAQVSHGTVRSSELEREKGRLIYSFDIKVRGMRGIQEVNIDALDGSVVNSEHETAKSEATEAKQDSMKH